MQFYTGYPVFVYGGAPRSKLKIISPAAEFVLPNGYTRSTAHGDAFDAQNI